MTKFEVLPKPRMAVLGHILDPVTREEIDRGLLLWFPGPRSFTGEDSCEFQVHGGSAVVSAVLSGLAKLRHFQPAEPGEFTKRAFHSGKLDLTEVEGLGDLIHAETELQRKQALLQMEGNLKKLYNDWRTALIKSLAHTEAYIDFHEDDNIESDVLKKVHDVLVKLAQEMDQHIKDGRCGQRLRDGVRIVIIGSPNVGKSSLLNTLCQRPAAIVTAIPGTTRDLIELHININGYPVILTDTAGLRNETNDLVEKEGIMRAKERAKDADLVMFVIDVLVWMSTFKSNINISQFIHDHIDNIDNGFSCKSLSTKETKTVLNEKCLVIFNKVDLLPDDARESLYQATKQYSNIICTSCVTEEGLPNLIDSMTHHLKLLCGTPSRENPSFTRARHAFHLKESSSSIKQYLAMTDVDDLPLAAHQLQKSLRHLGKISGTVGCEEVLDVIFKDFCIGK